MDLQEIMDQVASYLQRDDLTRCVRVSMGWRDVFLPHVWRKIKVSYSDQRCPCPEDHYPRRHLIHSLSLTGKRFELGTIIYPHLRSLEIFDLQVYKGPVVKVSMDLTKTCPSLTHLKLVQSDVTSTTWMALSAHPHIKRLVLWTVRVKAIDAPWFWGACEKIEDLHMSGMSIQGTIPEDLVFDQLRELSMSHNYGVDEEVQMDLMYRSTMLESLEWHLLDKHRPKTRRLGLPYYPEQPLA